MASRKLLGMIRLLRPEISMAVGVCVVDGQVMASNKFPTWELGCLGFICGFNLAATAMILNDYFDYEVDLINVPDRPLPSGVVTRREVTGLAIITTLASLAAGLALGWQTLLISVFFLALGFLYNWKAKQTGLPGNLIVSVCIAATFIVGAVTVSAPASALAWTYSILAFLLILGEEIASGVMDTEGDQKRACRSIALLKGRRFALSLSTALWLLMGLINFLPVLAGWLAARYLIFILICDVLLGYFTMRVLRSQNPREGRRAVQGTYLGAAASLALGLIGFLIWGSLL